MKTLMNKNIKNVLALTLSAFTIQTWAAPVVNGLVDISNTDYPEVNAQVSKQVDGRFYVNIPNSRWMDMKTAISPLSSANQITEPIVALKYQINERSLNKTLPIGLRVFVANNGDGSTQQRYKVSSALAKSGIIQTGDILLTYRPYWANTIKYAHIQMGVSHAGMAYVEGGSVYNMDMPLNSEMFDDSGMNKMSSSHYRDANGMYVHILRPRLAGNEQSNLREWAKLMVTNTKAQYQKQISFNVDYGSPNYDETKPTDLTFVKDLAKMALGRAPSKPRSMYCSEFAWSVLSLKNCDPNTLKSSANLDSDLGKCIRKVYEPMPVLSEDMAGMAEGPRAIVAAIGETQKLAKEEEYKMLQSVFTSAAPQPPSEKIMSNGHKMIDQQLTAGKFYDGLMGYYLNEDTNFRLQMKVGMNQTQKPNYSPTSLLVNAVLPKEKRIFNYVGTLTYAPEAEYKKVLSLAKSK